METDGEIYVLYMLAMAAIYKLIVKNKLIEVIKSKILCSL